MKIEKAVWALSLTGAFLLNPVGKGSAVSIEGAGQYAYVNLPEPIQKFTLLDFDGRMALKEALHQQQKTDNFSSVITDILYKKGPNSFTLENYKKCREIILLGRPLSEIDPLKTSVVEVTHLCGFKRLYAFLQFYEKEENKQKKFLENKDFYYVSNFIKEEKVFEDILDLYDFKTRTEAWHSFNYHIRKCLNKKENIELRNLYWQYNSDYATGNKIYPQKPISVSKTR